MHSGITSLMAQTRLWPVSGVQNPERAGDVIFVHGLNGNPFHYWSHSRNREHYWPEWIGKDLPNIGVWSLGYENAAFKSRRVTLLGGTGFRGFAMDLPARARNVLLHLKQNGIGTRPLVFVTHSMGGLLVKELLRKAKDSTNNKFRAILERTRGVCFIATPHIGADMAKWANYFRLVLGVGVALDELRPHGPHLLDLQDWYRNYVQAERPDIKTLSFHEKKPLPGLVMLVVEPGDADPGVPLADNHPLDEDHNTICKPESRDAPLYKEVLSFVRNDCFQIGEYLPVLAGVGRSDASTTGLGDSPGLAWPLSGDEKREANRGGGRILKLVFRVIGIAVVVISGFRLFGLKDRDGHSIGKGGPVTTKVQHPTVSEPANAEVDPETEGLKIFEISCH